MYTKDECLIITLLCWCVPIDEKEKEGKTRVELRVSVYVRVCPYSGDLCRRQEPKKTKENRKVISWAKSHFEIEDLKKKKFFWSQLIIQTEELGHEEVNLSYWLANERRCCC